MTLLVRGAIMIKSMNIKNIAIYDKKGIQFNDMEKINFIYGSNGSGKTTISNFIYDNAKFSDCLIEWENNLPLDVLVYNKNFREKNFGKGKLNGVFTLGQATTEQVKELERKKEELKTIKTEGIKNNELIETQKKEKEKLEKDFKESVWKKVYKKYSADFKEAFKGYLYKESFKNKLIQEYQKDEDSFNIPQTSEYNHLRERALTIFGEKPKIMETIDLISFDKILEIEENEIWEKIIVGKADVDIAELIQKLDINDWVNQGRNFIQNETCPFCQNNTISKDLKEQLANYFNETYLADINLLKTLKQEYTDLIQNIINQLNLIEIAQKSLNNTKLDIDKYSSCLKTLINQINMNNEYLNNKMKEPSRSIRLISIKKQADLIFELINQANIEIKRHNDITTNYKSEKNKLIKLIWIYMAEEYREEIKEFNNKKNVLEESIVHLENQRNLKRREYRKLDSEIKRLNKNITGIQPAVDEINGLLKYYGFLNFEIVSSEEEGFYQIKREDGTIAESTLSEGEITFITFLYYLQLAKGGLSKDKVNKER